MGKFIKVLNAGDLPTGTGAAVQLAGRRIAVFNVDGKFYAIDDECTHAGGALSEGPVQGKEVVCPWHGAAFDVETGEALTAPAYEKVRAYKVQVVGSEVQIEEP